MTSRWTPLAVIGAALLVLGGCGGDSSSDSACTAKPGADPGSIDAAADCPVSAVIAVDATGALQDKKLAREAGSAAVRAAEQTIIAGGHLRMVVFAGDANAVEVIYDDDVPTLEALDETRRGPLEHDLRRALGVTIDSALGVIDDDPELAARVRDLARGGTSDIARAVRNALREAKQEAGASSVTLVSDGAQASDQLMLERRLEAGDSSANLASRLGELLGDADGVDVVQVVGLGRLPDRVNQSARRTDELVEIWMTACEQTGAANCATTTEL